MPVTKIAVIYSIAQNRRRRVVIPSFDDRELDWHIDNIAPGEGVVVMPIDTLEQRPEGRAIPGKQVDAALEMHLGKPALSDRCIVTNAQGDVIHVLCADPAIDTHPHGPVERHDTAGVGWKKRNGVVLPLQASDVANEAL